MRIASITAKPGIVHLPIAVSQCPAGENHAAVIVAAGSVLGFFVSGHGVGAKNNSVHRITRPTLVDRNRPNRRRFRIQAGFTGRKNQRKGYKRQSKECPFNRSKNKTRSRRTDSTPPGKQTTNEKSDHKRAQDHHQRWHRATPEEKTHRGIVTVLQDQHQHQGCQNPGENKLHFSLGHRIKPSPVPAGWQGKTRLHALSFCPLSARSSHSKAAKRGNATMESRSNRMVS